MILPPPFSFIIGKHFWLKLKAAVRLVSRTLSQSSISVVSIEFELAVPAALTRISIEIPSALKRLNTSSTAVLEVMSQGTANTSLPVGSNSFAVVESLSALLAMI